MHPDLTYDEAVANREKVLITGKFYKADVFVAFARGQRFVVKDFGNKGYFERNLVGRTVIARECRAYGELAGVDGLPSRFKRLNPFAIAIEYLEGRDLGSHLPGEIRPGVIKQFELIIADLHERGWVHLDLQRRSNILLVDGKVFVIDLASAVHPGGVWLIGRCLTWALSLADRLSLIKLKCLYAPELLSGEERKWRKLRNLVMPRKW